MANTNIEVDEVTIKGVTYVPKGSETAVAPIKGKRAVVVIDRGWIVAGDVTEYTESGTPRVKLTRALHVFSFSSIGFAGMVDSPKSKNVDLRTMKQGFDFPLGSEIFRVWVDDNWGL